MIMGTAENGKDYPYIPTQITIPEGSDRAEISICPYADKESEPEEFVEVILSEGSYTVDDHFSATVRLVDRNGNSNVSKGDIDASGSITLVDAILALDVLSGELSDNVHIESSLNGYKIKLKDILYILNDIARK